MNLNPQLAKLLSESEQVNDFLRSADELIKDHSKYSYANIARRAGFSSRSFVRSLFKGDRNLTRSALPKFAKGLQLNQQVLRGIELLLEYPESTSDRQKAIRKRLRNIATKSPSHLSNIASKYFHWPFVYAALGSTTNGSQNLQQIASKIELESEEVENILEEMRQKGFVKKTKDQYLATNAFLNFSEMGGDQFFKRFFNNSLSLVRQAIAKRSAQEDHMFFVSTFSVKKRELPEMTSRLQSILMEFAENAESSEGDQVVLLQSALVPK